jgi:hypothetical protein
LKQPSSADNFVALRRGLMEHVEKGFISSSEFNVFVVLLMLADTATGTVLTNARILAERMRQGLKSIQWALYQLRTKRYVHYEDRRGMRGPYVIFVDKYRIRVAKGYYLYTSIFRDSCFIGEETFYAQLKVCQLYLNLGSGYRLLFRGDRLFTDFEIDFPTDFEKLTESLDKYTENPIVNTCLADFKADFQPGFRQTLIKNTEEEIEIHIFNKSHKPKLSPTKEEKQRIADLCVQLTDMNHGFNPYAFVEKNIKAKIPHKVTEHVLRQLVKYKPTIKKAWAYAIDILKKEYAKNLQ